MDTKTNTKPRKWAVDYILRSGDMTTRKYAYVRAADVFEALDMATHKIQFDMITTSRISPNAETFDGYEIMCIGAV